MPSRIQESEIKKQRPRAAVSFGFVWLVIIACAFQWRTFGKIPFIDLADETLYIGTLSIDWSLAYSFWYRCWHLITGEPLLSFRLNSAFISSAIAFLSFAIMRQLKVSEAWSLLTASFLILWEPIMGSPVKVTHFSLLLQLLVMWIAFKCFRDNSSRFFWAGACALWLCFVRQENLIFAAGAFGIFLIASIYKKAKFGESWRLPSWGNVYLALGAIPVLVNFSPFTKGRSWLAFRDHFCWSQGQINNDAIIREFFPTARTITAAMRENPAAFFDYGKKNLVSFFLNLPADMTAVFPGWNWHWLLIGVCLLGLLWSPKELGHKIFTRMKSNVFLFLLGVAGLELFKALIVVFFFQYDVKYTISTLAFFFLVMFYLLDPLADLNLGPWLLSAGASLIVIMILTIGLNVPSSFRWYYSSTVRESTEAIERWGRLPQLEGKRVMEFLDYSLYFNVKVTSQVANRPLSSFGFDSIDKCLDAYRTDYFIFSVNQLSSCNAFMEGKGCSVLLKVLNKCFAVIDKVGSTQLYKKASECSKR